MVSAHEGTRLTGALCRRPPAANLQGILALLASDELLNQHWENWVEWAEAEKEED